MRSRLPSCLASAALVAVVALGAPSASAQGTTDSADGETPAVRAENLYKRGHALIAGGHFDQACPLMEESMRLDPLMGTLLNLSFCHEHIGKPGQAWREYQIAISMAQKDHDKREGFALDSAQKLVARVSWIELAAPAGAAVTDLVVDGEAVPASIASHFAVDAGPHALALRVGGQLWEKSVVVAAGGDPMKIMIDVVGAPPSVGTPAPAAAAPVAPAPAAADQPSGSDGRRTAAWILGGVGVAGIAVGAVFGVETLADKSKANQNGCSNGTGCAQGSQGRHFGEQAWGYSTVSTVAFAVGLASIAAGTGLFIASRPASSSASNAPRIRVSPYAGPGGGGFTALGIW